MTSSVICLCCRKGKYKIREEEFYEEKGIMYGDGSNYTADTNGIGGTLADETKSAHIR